MPGNPSVRTMPNPARETIVDGYNLIHKMWKPASGPTSMERLRERLEAILTAYRRKTRRHVTLVYDGGAGSHGHSSSGAIDILFSGTAMTADMRIIELVRALGPRAGLATVITSDREVRQHAIAWGAACTSSEAFVAELDRLGLLASKAGKASGSASARKAAGQAPLSDREVEAWLKLFGQDP